MLQLLPAEPKSLDQTSYVAAAIREIEFMFACTVLTASLVNAYAGNRAINKELSLSSFLPPDPKLLSRTALAEYAPELKQETLNFVVAFLSSAASAKAAVQHGPNQTTGPASYPGALCRSWRITGQNAVDASDALFSDVVLPAAEGARWPAQRAALREASLGLSPCLSNDGRLVFPGWAERRGAERKKKGLRVSLTAPVEAEITLSDISQTGIGLAGVPALEAGNFVSITVPGGRVLAGTVVWQRALCAGVRLHELLSVNDPIMFSGAAA